MDRLNRRRLVRAGWGGQAPNTGVPLWRCVVVPACGRRQGRALDGCTRRRRRRRRRNVRRGRQRLLPPDNRVALAQLCGLLRGHEYRLCLCLGLCLLKRPARRARRHRPRLHVGRLSLILLLASERRGRRRRGCGNPVLRGGGGGSFREADVQVFGARRSFAP
jgi:hypothetical protein